MREVKYQDLIAHTVCLTRVYNKTHICCIIEYRVYLLTLGKYEISAYYCNIVIFVVKVLFLDKKYYRTP